MDHVERHHPRGRVLPLDAALAWWRMIEESEQAQRHVPCGCILETA
jgi:hypothetical protein